MLSHSPSKGTGGIGAGEGVIVGVGDGVGVLVAVLVGVGVGVLRGLLVRFKVNFLLVRSRQKLGLTLWR